MSSTHVRLLPPGVWSPGRAAGDRRFVDLFGDGGLRLDRGGSFGPITVAYEAWGHPTPSRDNAVLIEHALTGDSHAAGPAGPGHVTPGWWNPLIGPGAAIDTDRWWVICPNTLGGCQGTTGPASASPDGSPWGSRFPFMTIRDQVAVEAAFADALGIDQWAAVVGGSMGGMRALEWAVTYPERVSRLVVLAVGAAATAEQIALCAVQAQAIRLDSGFRGGDYYDAPPGQGPELGPGTGAAHRPDQLPVRAGTPDPLWPPTAEPGRAAHRWAIRGRELPGPSRRKAGAPIRCQQLPHSQPGHGPPRCRKGSGGHRPGAPPGPGHRHGDRRGQRPPVPLAAAAGAGRRSCPDSQGWTWCGHGTATTPS